MNEAVFVKKVSPKVQEEFTKIREAQKQIYDIEMHLEIEIGVLTIDEDGTKILVDMEKLNTLIQKAEQNFFSIRESYQKLIALGAVEIGRTEPPCSSNLQKYLQDCK